MTVQEKSGRATKNKLIVGACVIDSGYRGEVMIHLFNNSSHVDVMIMAGEKIAQVMLTPCWTGQPVLTDEVSDTERGEGRMGSSGLV